MNKLSPCLSCRRHLRVTDDACPFCGAQIARAALAIESAAPPRARPSRAAIFAAGATLAGLAACSSSSTGGDAAAGGTAGMSAGGQGGGGTGGAAARDGGNGDAVSTIDGPIAIYSAAFPPPVGPGSK